MVKSTKRAFTLAEVLTTLMVIGVVAAMTIPTLLNSTTEQQQKVAYKKAMSVLSQGVQLMTAREEECKVTTDATLTECMANVISGTRFKVTDVANEKMEADTTNVGNVIVTNDGLAFAFYYKPRTGDDATSDATVGRSLEDICGKATSNTDDDSDAMFGAKEEFYDGSKAKCIVIVDTNGPSKGSHAFAQTAESKIISGSALNKSILASINDQQALLLTGGGVRPLWTSACVDMNKGYEWVYGKEHNPVATTSTK